jgi:hypothetical protein
VKEQIARLGSIDVKLGGRRRYEQRGFDFKVPLLRKKASDALKDPGAQAEAGFFRCKALPGSETGITP